MSGQNRESAEKQRMKKKLVIFDFDGTLADTRKAIVAAKQETMRRLGLPVLSEEECASSIGLTAPAGFRRPRGGGDRRELLLGLPRGRGSLFKIVEKKNPQKKT